MDAKPLFESLDLALELASPGSLDRHDQLALAVYWLVHRTAVTFSLDPPLAAEQVGMAARCAADRLCELTRLDTHTPPNT